MNQAIIDLAQRVLSGKWLDRHQALALWQYGQRDAEDMLYWANRIRQHFLGNKVTLCCIVPGRLGGCSQDCAFCAQSVHYDTSLDKAPQLMSDQQILQAAKEAKRNKIRHFGIVYSGKSVSADEFERLIALTKRIRSEIDIGVCMALGILNQQQCNRLAAAGVERYNHNLETSERYFSHIVSTHTYVERIETIRFARQAGLGVCAGGIFGIGETIEDRIEMALLLRQLGADTVPMNFLHPIAGTPLANQPPMAPHEILLTIALYRFLLPTVHLKIAGGRVKNLRDLHSWIFYAGGSSILSGNYLTTAGRAVPEDIQMLTDLGLQPDTDL